MAATASLTRQESIKRVWPDKLLYGSIMLFVTGLVGFLHAAVVIAFDVTYSRNVPAILRAWPPSLALVLSGVAAGCAYLALKRQNSRFAMLGAGAGVLSMGLLGVGTLFSLIALGFLVASRMEGEDAALAESGLDASMWPDKSLAASLLQFMAGLTTLAWGAMVFGDVIGFGGDLYPVWGAAQMLAGVAMLAGAWFMYHQRGRWVGLVAGVLGTVTLGAYVLGPILAVASLVLLYQAWDEDEFED